MPFVHGRMQFDGEPNKVVGVSIVEANFYRSISVGRVVGFLNDLLQKIESRRLKRCDLIVWFGHN